MSKLDQLLEELQKAKAKLEKPEGISDRGIEVRRADAKVPGIVAHGYGRIMSPEKHGERAKAWAKQDLARLKAQPKPNLTKEETEKADKLVNPKDPVLNPGKFPPKAQSEDKQKAYAQKVSTMKKEEEMEKDSVNPALAPKERKIKDLQAQIDAGTYKPDSKKIANAMLKEESDEELDKSNYGPKGGGQYSAADNARRKANNTGSKAGFGSNTNEKSYSSKPGQQSAQQQASTLAAKQKELNRKQPVKIYSEEEKAALASKMGLKKFDVQAVDKPPMPSTIHKEAPIKDKEQKQLVDTQGNTIECLEFTKDGQWTLKAK